LRLCIIWFCADVEKYLCFHISQLCLRIYAVWSVYKCLEWTVLQVPFIHFRHNTKDRSLGVGRDISAH